MNTMSATHPRQPAAPPATSPTPSAVVWLRTDRPVVPVNPSTWGHLREVENTLHHGVSATTDRKRPGFYEIEAGDNWYYIHIPSRITGVYLVAAGKKPACDRASIMAHHCA